MTSEPAEEAYVWVWLPEHSAPVVAGRVERAGSVFNFNYGQSYLERSDAIALYVPELPLQSGRISPLKDLEMAGCLLDAGPDAWGQRVVTHRLLGRKGDIGEGDITTLTYLLESGSDRIGALDFQASPSEYVQRGTPATLDELVNAARRIEEGTPFSSEVDGALLHGSSIGGARPKALLDDGERKLIAKFSSGNDPWPVVKGEFAAMELAQRVGLNVAPVELTRSMGKDVLLVDRFDRTSGGSGRRLVVSALTMLGLGEMFGRYATYPDLADQMRIRFDRGDEAVRELFARIVFNVLVGNTDDHARNHAAFWDGETLELTPAFDICPQARAGGVAAQAMAIGRSGFRNSQLAGCVKAASTYLLSEREAREIIEHQVSCIETEWDAVADAAAMTEVDRDFFWHRQFLNPYAFEGY